VKAHKTTHFDALSDIYTQPSAVFVAPNTQYRTADIVPSEEAKAEIVDEDMNRVYKALRVVLPPARFAKVHQEQVAWLKRRDIAKSVEEKSKLIEERTLIGAISRDLAYCPLNQPKSRSALVLQDTDRIKSKPPIIFNDACFRVGRPNHA
jgi:uncharacterized protein YecT (DUF1311 family)